MGGAEYSGLFRGYEVYPVLGVAWIPDPEWRLDVLLPRQVRLHYLPNDHSSIYFSVDLEGDTLLVRAPVNYAKTPNSIRRHAPRFGEHGAELLGELGYDESEIAALMDAGAVQHDSEPD